MPGVYTAPEPTWETRIRAADAYRPGCILTGAVAAMITWWPEVPVNAVTVAVPHQVKGTHRAFSFEQRRVPLELVVHRQGLRIAAPALSVLDLIPELGGRVIDEALRRRAVRLTDLWRALALCPGRSHNDLRRALLKDSRDEPWSEAERTAHRLLREAGISGWRTNYPITLGGVTFTVDIAFPQQRVVIEVDSWQHHGTRSAFVKDRWRYSRLAAADWAVLPLAAVSISDEPDDVLEVLCAALTRRR